MAKETGISWCDSTVNPVVGCDGCELHRAGCKESHCYAAGLVGRYAGLPGWPASFDKPEFFSGRIEKACRWPDLTGKARPDKPWLNGYPRTIFLNDLSDSFSESLPVDWLAPYLPAMAAAPHIWIICTKRPSRMRQFFTTRSCPRNFWLLTTVTSAATLKRVDELLRIDCTLHGISAEPLLGPLDVRQYVSGRIPPELPLEVKAEMWGRRGIGWVIVGGESGAGARPMPSHWAFDLRDYCVAAGTPFFFKQWSEWIDCGCAAFGKQDYGPCRHIRSDGTFWPAGEVPADENADVLTVVRAGVKVAGTELGAREWRQMPEVLR